MTRYIGNKIFILPHKLLFVNINIMYSGGKIAKDVI